MLTSMHCSGSTNHSLGTRAQHIATTARLITTLYNKYYNSMFFVAACTEMRWWSIAPRLMGLTWQRTFLVVLLHPRSQGANSLDMPWQSKILCYPTNLTSTFWRTSTSTPLLPKALLHKSRCAWIWIALPAETSFGFESVTLIVLNSPNSS